MIAFLIGLGLRFYNLGNSPLSDDEARLALQALRIFQTGPSLDSIVISGNTAYILFTGALFELFSSTNFLARFWPALAGSLLIWVPYIFIRSNEHSNRQLSNKNYWAGIILAFGIAISPGLVTASRQAGSPMIALGFGLLAIVFWLYQKPIISGISAGIAILSGPGVFIGAIILLLAYSVTKLIVNAEKKYSTENIEEEREEYYSQYDVSEKKNERHLLRDFLISFTVTILLAGTLFMIYPPGLGAWLGSFTSFINGWVSIPFVPITRMFAGLVFYEFFAVIFGSIVVVASVIRASSSKEHDRNLRLFLIFWVLFGLILILVYPERKIIDLIWVLVPLWALAAIGVSSIIAGERLNIISIIEAGIVVLLSGLLWYTIASTTRITAGTQEISVQIAIIVGIIALLLLTVLLVGLGWSWKISRDGFALGISAAILLYTISVLWSASQFRHNQAQELWSPDPAPGQIKLMSKILTDMSAWNSGFYETIDIASTVDSPSLRWVLRSYPNTIFVSQLDRENLPSIVITNEGEEFPTLSVSFRGEDFVWLISKGWNGALPPDFARWFAFREGPVIFNKIILWSNSNLFPTGSDDPESLDINLEGQNSDDPFIENYMLENEKP